MRNIAFLLAFLLIAAPCRAAVVDDGDPAKAHSVEKLIGAMDANERDYYYKSFDYAMTNMKMAEKYQWKSYISSGFFEGEMPFVHKDTVCRNFRETVTNSKLYTVSSEGVACKRVGAVGWCKLHRGDALTCAMEPPHGVIDSTVQGVREKLDDIGTQVDSERYHLTH